MGEHGCCGVPREALSAGSSREPVDFQGVVAPGPRVAVEPLGGWIAIPAQSFLMGDDGSDAVPGDDEGPVREVAVKAFEVAATAVSVDEWRAFARATGWQTDAEREGWSFVFAGHLPADHPPTRALVEAPWWRQVFGADWAHPEGPASNVGERGRHPVVHVSWRDAQEYCAWAGVRLPSEAEWELAARGGLAGARYPWGDELEPGGEHRCNIWQGDFPLRDLAADGYAGTAPVDAFAPNGLGLFNTSGNAWEWCADRFTAPNAAPGSQVVRGGSHLCHASYCNRYRVSARTGNTPDSSLSHTGFRVARSS